MVGPGLFSAWSTATTPAGRTRRRLGAHTSPLPGSGVRLPVRPSRRAGTRVTRAAVATRFAYSTGIPSATHIPPRPTRQSLIFRPFHSPGVLLRVARRRAFRRRRCSCPCSVAMTPAPPPRDDGGVVADGQAWGSWGNLCSWGSPLSCPAAASCEISSPTALRSHRTCTQRCCCALTPWLRPAPPWCLVGVATTAPARGRRVTRFAPAARTSKRAAAAETLGPRAACVAITCECQEREDDEGVQVRRPAPLRCDATCQWAKLPR